MFTASPVVGKGVHRFGEFYAAYLYLAMMTYFDGRSLSGFAHWMRLQAREEVEHRPAPGLRQVPVRVGFVGRVDEQRMVADQEGPPVRRIGPGEL